MFSHNAPCPTLIMKVVRPDLAQTCSTLRILQECRSLGPTELVLTHDRMFPGTVPSLIELIITHFGRVLKIKSKGVPDQP
jgi:hypothetical protein